MRFKSLLTKLFTVFMAILLSVGMICANTNEIKAEEGYEVEVIRGYGRKVPSEQATYVFGEDRIDTGYSIKGRFAGGDVDQSGVNSTKRYGQGVANGAHVTSIDVHYGSVSGHFNVTGNQFINYSNGALSQSSSQSANSLFKTAVNTSATYILFYKVNDNLDIVLNYANGNKTITFNNVDEVNPKNDKYGAYTYDNNSNKATLSVPTKSLTGNYAVDYDLSISPMQDREITSINMVYAGKYYYTIAGEELSDTFFITKDGNSSQAKVNSGTGATYLKYIGSTNVFEIIESAADLVVTYNYEEKITFDANGGKFADDALTKEFLTTNSVLTDSLSDPTNGDMKFMGWYDDETAGNLVDPSTYVFVVNTTLYAHWANANANTVTVVNATNSDGDPITTLDDSAFSSFNGTGVITIAPNTAASFDAHASYGNLKSISVGSATIILENLNTQKYIDNDFTVSDSEGNDPLLKVIYNNSDKLFNIDLINVSTDLTITLNYDKSRVTFNVDHRDPVIKDVDFGSTVSATDSELNSTTWYLDDRFVNEFDFSSPIYDDINLYAKSHKVTLYKGYRVMPGNFVVPNNATSFFGSESNDYSYTTYTAGDFNSASTPTEYRFGYKASADTVTLASFDVYYGNSQPLLGLVAQNNIYVDGNGNLNTTSGRQILAVAGVSAHAAATTIYMRIVNNPLEDLTIVWHYTAEFPITIKNVDSATCSDLMPGNFKYDANTKIASYSGNYQNDSGMSFVVNPLSNVEVESIYVSLKSGDAKYDITIDSTEINNHFFLKKVKDDEGIASGFEIVDSYETKNNTPFEYDGSTNTIKITELANEYNIEYKYRSKVTFDANGGSFTNGDLTKDLFTKDNLLETYPGKKDLVNDGYKFVGWYDDPTNGELVDLTEEIISNTTVYAHWSEATINTISFVNAINDDGLDGITTSDSSIFESFDAGSLEATIAYNKQATIKAYATHGTVKGLKLDSFVVDDLTKTYYVNSASELSDASSNDDMASISYDVANKCFDINILKLTDDIQIELLYEDINITYHILDSTLVKQVEFNNSIPEEHIPNVKEYKFLGFYYDDGYNTAYDNEKLIDDVDIYCSFSDYYVLTIKNAEKANSSAKYSASTWKGESPEGVTFDENAGTIEFDGAWQDSAGKQVLVYANKGLVSKLTITYGEKEFVIDSDNLYKEMFLKENGEFGNDGDEGIFLKFAGTKNYIYNHQFYIKPFIVNHDINVEIEYTSTITYDKRDGIDSRYNIDLYTPKTTFNKDKNIAYVDSATFSNNISETGDAGISGGVVRLIVAPYNDKMTGLTMSFERYDSTEKKVINDVVTYTNDYLNGLSNKRKDVNNDYANYRIVISGGNYMIKFAKLNCNVTIRPIAADSLLEEGAVINNDGTLKLNFVLHTFKGLDTSKAYVTTDDGVTKTYLNELSMGKDGRGARTYTYSSKNFNIQNIVDEFTIKFVDEDDIVIKEADTSLVSYLDTLLDMDSISNGTKTFVKSMLNYGANCQVLFDYETDNLANGSLQAADKDLSNIEKDEKDNFEISGATEGIKPLGLNLALNETIDLNVYFNIDKDHSIDDFTFEYNGNSLEPVQYSGKQYYVTIGSVAAPDLADRYPIIVKNSDKQGDLTVELSVFTFAYLALDRYSEDLTQTNLVNAMKALYAYGNAASGVKEEISSIVTVLDDLKPYDGNRLKIAFIGDSITYGYQGNHSDDHVEYSYPAILGRQLGNKFEIGNFGKSSSYAIAAEYEYSAHNINGQNERLSYKKTYEFKDSLDFNPDVVCIMLGTNDRHSLNASQESYQVLKDALKDLIDTYKQLESVKKIYILTSIVTMNPDSAIGEDGKAFAHALSDGPLQELQKAVAAENGVEVIDVYSATRDAFYNNPSGMYDGDNLHPNRDGYTLMANVLYRYFTGLDKYDNSSAGLFYTNITNDDSSDASCFNYYAQGAADPFVLYENGIFYMYPTTGKTSVSSVGGIDVYTSTDMTHWKHEPNKVFTPGGDKSWGVNNVWAPEVVKEGDTYYLFYSANGNKTTEDKNNKRELNYISVATSKNPSSKFYEYEGNSKTKAEPLIMFENHQNEIPSEFKTTILGRDGNAGFIKVIDASPFVDPISGKKYLYMCADLGPDGASQSSIIGMEMEDWLTPKYETLTRLTEYNKKTVGGAELTGLSAEGGNTNEGPSVYYKDGTYYLTFSTFTYKNSNYQVRQAISTSPLGTYTKLDVADGGVVISTNANTIRQSAGHSSFLQVGNELYLVYHTFFNDESYGPDDATYHRKAAIDRIEFVENKSGVIVMQAIGTTSTPQLLPQVVSGYRNISSDATISATNTKAGSNTNLLNDKYVSLNGIKVRDDYEANAGENTITYTFNSVKTIRGILVYNSSDENKRFTGIKSIVLHTNNGDIEYENIEYNPLVKGGKTAIDQTLNVTFYDTNVSSIDIVFEEANAYEIPEILIVGK